MPLDQQDRDELLKQTALKVLLIAAVVALVVGLGTWIVVKGLGLSDTSAGSSGGQIAPVHPLPSTALPVPEQSLPGNGDVSPSPHASANGDLHLDAAPVTVKPMQRINLTGTWAGQDNVSLSVQRLEGGTWTDFGVSVPVHVGTFETYVMTGHPGPQKFRVYDAGTKTASNEVTVTVG